VVDDIFHLSVVCLHARKRDTNVLAVCNRVAKIDDAIHSGLTLVNKISPQILSPIWVEATKDILNTLRICRRELPEASVHVSKY